MAHVAHKGRFIANTLHGRPSSSTARHHHCVTAIAITRRGGCKGGRATAINHATGMIRLNCCSHVSALETAPRCAVGRATPEGGEGGRQRGVVSCAQILPARRPSRTRPSGHWSIDFAAGGWFRVTLFPAEGRVDAGGGDGGRRQGWGERGCDWPPRRPRVRGHEFPASSPVSLSLSLWRRSRMPEERIERIGNADSPVDPSVFFLRNGDVSLGVFHADRH